MSKKKDCFGLVPNTESPSDSQLDSRKYGLKKSELTAYTCRTPDCPYMLECVLSISDPEAVYRRREKRRNQASTAPKTLETVTSI